MMRQMRPQGKAETRWRHPTTSLSTCARVLRDAAESSFSPGALPLPGSSTQSHHPAFRPCVFTSCLLQSPALPRSNLAQSLGKNSPRREFHSTQRNDLPVHWAVFIRRTCTPTPTVLPPPTLCPGPAPIPKYPLLGCTDPPVLPQNSFSRSLVSSNTPMSPGAIQHCAASTLRRRSFGLTRRSSC